MFGASGDVCTQRLMMETPGSSRVFVTNLNEMMENGKVDVFHPSKIAGSTCSMTSMSLSKGVSSSIDKYDIEVRKSSKKDRKSRKKSRRHRRQKRLGDAALESDSSREYHCVTRRTSRGGVMRSSLMVRASPASSPEGHLYARNKPINASAEVKTSNGSKRPMQHHASTQQAQQQKKLRSPRSPGHERHPTFVERLMEVLGNLNNGGDLSDATPKKTSTGCAPFLFSSCTRQLDDEAARPLSGSFFCRQNALAVITDDDDDEDITTQRQDTSHDAKIGSVKNIDAPMLRDKAGTHTTDLLTSSASSSYASLSSLRNESSPIPEGSSKDQLFHSLSRTLSSPLPPTSEEVQEEFPGNDQHQHMPDMAETVAPARVVTPTPMCSSVGTNDMQLSIIPSGEECDTSSESTMSRRAGFAEDHMRSTIRREADQTPVKAVPPPIFQQHYNDAVNYESRGMLQEALHTYGAAITAITSATGFAVGSISPRNAAFSSERAKALHRMGVVQWKAGLYRGALSSLHAALDAHSHLEIKQDNNQEDLAETLHQIGTVYSSMGSYEAAMKSLQSSLRVRRNASSAKQDKDDVHVARTLVAMGSVHEGCGRLKRATLCFQRALEAQKLALGESHVDVAATMSKLGMVYEKLGNLQVAMSLFDEALFTYRVKLGHMHVDVAVSLCNVGRVFEAWGDFDRAGRSYEEARQVFVKSVGRYHRNVGTVLYLLGALNCRRGWYERGIAAHTEACNVQRLALGENHPDVAVTMEAMAKAFVMMGRHAEASGLFSSVLQLRKGLYGANHVLVAITLDGMGQTLQDYASRIAATNTPSFDMAGAKDTASFYYELEARKLSKEALLLYQCNNVSMDHPRMKQLMERIDDVNFAA